MQNQKLIYISSQTLFNHIYIHNIYSRHIYLIHNIYLRHKYPMFNISTRKLISRKPSDSETENKSSVSLNSSPILDVIPTIAWSPGPAVPPSSTSWEQLGTHSWNGTIGAYLLYTTSITSRLCWAVGCITIPSRHTDCLPLADLLPSLKIVGHCRWAGPGFGAYSGGACEDDLGHRGLGRVDGGGATGEQLVSRTGRKDRKGRTSGEGESRGQ